MAPSARSLIGLSASGKDTNLQTDEHGILTMGAIETARVAAGQYYYAFDRSTLSVGKTFLIRVGTNPVDFWWNSSAGLTTPIDLVEGVTVTAAGTPYTLQNYNRTVSATPGFTVFTAPTVSAGATIFQTQAALGVALTPASGNSLSALANPSIPWRLKPNTDYTITYTPLASILVTFHGVFYEVI